MVFQTENAHKKKIPAGNIMSVIVAYKVNIFQLSVKYRPMASVDENVGDYSICSKYFSTLCKIPTETLRPKIYQ
jgi:hypothetical protein